MGGRLARVDVDLVQDAPPFLYARAYIPTLYGQETGWFLQPVDVDKDCQGMKCILASNAREELVRRLGLVADPLYVKSIRILRTSKSGKSFIVEVAEYATEADLLAQQTPEKAAA